jgi:hypothetical protein
VSRRIYCCTWTLEPRRKCGRDSTRSWPLVRPRAQGGLLNLRVNIERRLWIYPLGLAMVVMWVVALMRGSMWLAISAGALLAAIGILRGHYRSWFFVLIYVLALFVGTLVFFFARLA